MCDHLILEFWTDRKEAELPISVMSNWTTDQVEAFERIQELLGRRVLMRLSDSPPLLSRTTGSAGGVKAIVDVVTLKPILT